ncbi:cupin domain-containing protein [Terrimonas rubra]|uniref:Cupin domain-containing protein n=1 Tax=Terrimonas rubra TaxID=1035890 RepID=A0ABW6A6M4_9BACT
MTDKSSFIVDSDMPWEETGEGVKRKVMAWDERLMLVKVHFETGAVGTVHQHPHTQISHIEKGVFEVEIGGDKKLLKSGDAFYVPPNIPHGVVCLQEGVLIDMFSPMREDFADNKK